MPRSARYLPVLTAFVVFAAMVGGCRDFSVDEPAESSLTIVEGVEAFPDQPFELAIGETARIDTFNLALKFTHVPGDTRCALELDCPSSGLGQVLADLYRDSGAHTQFVLTIPGQVGLPYTWGNEIQDDENRFRLTRLEPYPVAGQQIALSDYRATIVVHRF